MRRKKLNLGFSFGDFIETSGTQKSLTSKEKLKVSETWEKDTDDTLVSREISQWRLVPIYIVLCVFILLLAVRAFSLQLIEGASFLQTSQGNHVQVNVAHAARGVIYDRNGKVLVRNQPGYRVAVHPLDLPENWEKSVVQISESLEIDSQEVIKKIKDSDAESVTILEEVPNERVLSLKSENEKYPWLSIELTPKREYLFGSATSSILGYTGEASEEDLQTTQTTPYSAGDQVGRAGVEATFERQLRGANGYSLVKIDSQGKAQGVLFETKAASGNDINLSIDIELQEYIYKELKAILKKGAGKGAAAVVSDPHTGEILAMVSVPTYDNNLFTRPLKSSVYESLVKNPGHVFLNRAIGATYPPGSTFKMIVSAAGLDSGTITKDTLIEDTGFIKLGDVTFNNWLWLDRQQKEGPINVVRALARSNDTFYYRLGQRLEVDKIAQFASKFGLGVKTGVELPGEAAGLVPTPAWKEATFNQVWFPGETINYSIGQGYLLVSPIQLNTATAAFANGGKLIAPTLLHNQGTKVVNPKVTKAETLEVIREGMYANTFGDGNVSYLFNNMKIKTAGKTGTAESGGKKASPHAWYTGFAPYENPEIAVTVFVERAGHGSEVSAPAVKKIFEWWFAHR